LSRLLKQRKIIHPIDKRTMDV